VRATSGASSVFGFTGEQFDSETGFTFLRARYLDPRLGRFPSMDSVQPNAPGTQGYNPYSYAGNNPTTWLDPSGHYVLPWGPVITIAVAVVVWAYLYVNLLPALVPEENREEFDRNVQNFLDRIWRSGGSRGSKGNASDKGGQTGSPCPPGDLLCTLPPSGNRWGSE
jgi:RHS repeat-associated protein